MEILENIGFLLEALFALGFTIFIHELGHFLAARKRGLVIKRFSIGFGPRIFGWTRNGVEYRLSAIPFGGYVALPQLVDMGRLEGAEGEKPEADKPSASKGEDESEDKDNEENKKNSGEEPLPKISYTDKMIVSVMGAVFNVLLAFVLSCILWQFGYDVSDAQLTTKVGYVADKVEQWNPDTEKGVEIDGPAKDKIFPGDEILSVDGVSVENFMEIRSLIVTGKGEMEDGGRVVTLMISRNGEEKQIEISPTVVSREEMRAIGIGPKHTFFIGKLTKGLPGEKAGLEIGDQPVSFDDGIEIHSFNFLYDYLQKREANETVSLTVRKGGEQGALQTYAIKLTEKELQVGTKYVEKEVFFGLFTTKEAQPVMGKVRLIGFTPKYKIVTTYPNPIVLITRRVKDMYHTLSGLVSPKSDVKLRNMSGPVGIVENLSLFAQIDFKKLLWFVVFINVNLAILNLLPIPVLDGGHMLFATIEKIRGKPLPLAFLERTQVLFIVLLFSFMLYVTFFDVQRLFP
jgi:regulator of sigma E protease